MLSLNGIKYAVSKPRVPVRVASWYATVPGEVKCFPVGAPAACTLWHWPLWEQQAVPQCCVVA